MSPAILSAEYSGAGGRVIMAAMSGYRLRDAWPWRRFTLDTSLPPAEAAAALAGQIGPGSAFRGARTGPLQFRISRVIAYRNSFLPVVGVTIEPRPSGGARLLVTMRMMAPVIVFMAFWMTGATGAALFGVTLLTRGSPAGLAALLFPALRGRARRRRLRVRSEARAAAVARSSPAAARRRLALPLTRPPRSHHAIRAELHVLR